MNEFGACIGNDIRMKIQDIDSKEGSCDRSALFQVYSSIVKTKSLEELLECK